jgi:hypothetical protein
LVLGGPREDACVPGQPATDPEDREVHRFSAGRGEGDLAAVGVQLLGEEVTSAIERRASGAAFGVEAGRVGRGKVAERGDNLGEDRCRGGVIEVNAALRGRAGGGDRRQPRL